jgi:hypothetical protein
LDFAEFLVQRLRFGGVFADLAIEGSAFADQVAALADEQLQGGPGDIARRLQQSTAGDGGAVQGGKIGIVGFVAGVDALAVLFGNEGMEDAGFKTRGDEGTLDDAMIAAGTFDGDDAIRELVLGEGLPDLDECSFEIGSIVRDGGGRNEDATVEIGEQEFRTDLCAVEADNAEIFGSDQLDAGMQHAAWLADTEVETTRLRAFAGT